MCKKVTSISWIAKKKNKNTYQGGNSFYFQSISFFFYFVWAFTGNMNKKQRLEIEDILGKVFEGFTDERLVGKYESMVDMTEARRNELVKEKYFSVWLVCYQKCCQTKKSFFSPML